MRWSGLIFLAFSASSMAQSGDTSVFREAFPQCFKLFPDQHSAEHKTCLEVSALNAHSSYTDEELAAKVQTEPRPPSEPQSTRNVSAEEDIFRTAFPRCFSLYPRDDSLERKVCLEISAFTAHTPYTSDHELDTAVKREILRREAAERVAEEERRKAERVAEERRRKAKRLKAERDTELARKPLGWVLDEWELGGFGNVLIARITLQNNSDARLADFHITCRTYGNSGTALSAPKNILYEALAPRQRRTFEVNLGLVHSQSARANCAVKPGR